MATEAQLLARLRTTTHTYMKALQASTLAEAEQYAAAQRVTETTIAKNKAEEARRIATHSWAVKVAED